MRTNPPLSRLLYPWPCCSPRPRAAAPRRRARPARPRPPAQRRHRLARPGHLPDRRRSLRQWRSQQRRQRRARRARRAITAATGRASSTGSTTSEARRDRAVDQPGGQQRRARRRLRQLSRLLDPGLAARQPALRRPAQAARAGRRRPRARHAGDPRRGHQPHGPAVLLRHQRQRPARRVAQRRRHQPHLRADLQQPGARQPSAAPTSAPTASRAASTSSASLEWDPEYDPRGIQGWTSRRLHRRRPTSAFPDWPAKNRTPPPRPPAWIGWPDDKPWFDDPAWYNRAAASTCGGTRATTRPSSCASKRSRATSPAGCKDLTPTTRTSRTR